MKEFDVIILGGGPGGYETALYANENGLSVLLIEKAKLGGTCLNCGCIPTKTYNHIAKTISELSKANEIALDVNYSFDMKKALERKNKVVSNLQNGIAFMLNKAGVEVVNGYGTLINKETVKVDDEEYFGKNIIIATGSSNLDTIIPGSNLAMDSSDLLDLDNVPNNLAIIGGGVIGCEMATIFKSFGSNVTIFEGMDSILPNIDKEISRRLSSSMTRSGIKINTKTKVLEIKQNAICYEKNGETFEEIFDNILLAIGRKPNINNIGLDEVGIAYTKKGIVVNEYFETNINNVYAIGDCNGKIMLAHFAEHAGKIAIDHILGRKIKEYPCPSAIFTIPEVSQIGYTEEELKARGLDYSVKKTMYRSNGKALAMNEADGFVKILTMDDKIAGAHIIGYDASTLIHEIMILMNTNTNVVDAKKFIFSHPTLSELIKNTL